MSKTLETKNRIVELLSAKRMTLTELSDTLGLAPSTINQHIKELLSANAIRKVNNPFILKWKYYEVNPNFMGIDSARSVKKPSVVMANPFFKAATAIIILGVLAAALFGLAGSGSGQIVGAVSAGQALAPGPVQAGTTVFSISDAPGVSTLTALNLTIDAMYVHSTTTGKFYQVFGSNSAGANTAVETFDLVKLKNISQVISGANLSAGSYDEIVMYVTNATAVINGNATTVFLPSSKFKIFGNFNLSSNTVNWLNIDINLAKSVHITGNGKVVMLPVMNLRASEGAQVDVNSSNTIEVRSEGHVVADEHMGMDENGSISANTLVPANATVEVQDDNHGPFGGRIMVVENSHINGTMIVNAHDGGVVIITNATNITSLTQNVPANVMIKIVGPNVNGDLHMGCMFEDGAAHCNSTDNISATVLGRIMGESGPALGAGMGIGMGANVSISRNRSDGETHIDVTNRRTDVSINVTVNSDENAGLGNHGGMNAGTGLGTGMGMGVHTNWSANATASEHMNVSINGSTGIGADVQSAREG